MPTTIDGPPLEALQFELAAISVFEGMIRQIQADQYERIQRARELARLLDGPGEEASAAERDLSTRSFVAELATTLGVHEASASRLVTEAERLTGPRRATLAALEAGELGLTQVRSVLEFTSGLPAEVADGVERVAVAAAAASAAEGLASTNAEVRRRMRRARERLHLESLGARRARAVDERRVCVGPAPDGMAWLSIHLEAERALAIERRLGALAQREAKSDIRTPTQRAADLAADLMLGGTLARGSAAGSGAVEVPVRINVTVPVMTLLGLSEESAELDGYGPIDADTARRLAAHAPSMRRILVHPESGAVLSYGRDSYRAPADLDGFVRVRDGCCRFPGCSRRADRADLDHTTAWQHGGQTSAANLAALCRHHHRLKHESGWRVEQQPGGVMRWTSPAGHVLRTLPERPFAAVGVGEGVEPPTSPSTDPPDGIDVIDPIAGDPPRALAEQHDRFAVQAPF